MKRLLLILILTLSFQSWTKADDISDFQIEGMSIGDSLLDHFSEKEIQVLIKHEESFLYKDRKFAAVTTHHTKKPYKKITGKFDFSGVTIDPSDNNYIIHGLRGTLRFPKNISSCLIKKKEIEKTLASIFNKAEINISDKNHSYDKTGNSKTYSTYYYIDGGNAAITCVDWSDKLEKKWYDRLNLFITSDKLEKFLYDEAYN